MHNKYAIPDCLSLPKDKILTYYKNYNTNYSQTIP